jgi:hypothetical protein
LGRKLNISTKKQFNEIVLDTSRLIKGIYLLKIEGTEYSQSRKIIVKGN